MNTSRLIRTAIAALLLSLAGALSAQTYVGNLNGTHISSTFTTSTDGDNALSNFGWTSFSGASARIFGQTGGTTNDVLIAGAGQNYANYGVQFDTGVALLPNTTYTVTYLVGYVSAGTLASNNFTAQLGTWNGSTFNSLASSAATVNRTANTMSGASIGADVANSIAVTFMYTTPASGLSADPIMFRWEQTNSAIQTFGQDDFFGIDNVTISYVTAVPEPSTYAALLGAVALGFVAWRRRSRVGQADCSGGL